MLLALALAACGDVTVRFDSGRCADTSDFAVIVRFEARNGAGPVAVAASGTLDDGRFAETMVPIDFSRSDTVRSFALAGGRDRSGTFDVSVVTEFDERFRWDRVQVPRDFCGPYTAVLRARLDRY